MCIQAAAEGKDAGVFNTTVASPSMIFIENDDTFTQAFIAAEGKPLFEVEKPSVERSLIALLAAYYVFNLSYP